MSTTIPQRQLRNDNARMSTRSSVARPSSLIAATAHANDLDLYTRNASDFAGIEDLVHVVAV